MKTIYAFDELDWTPRAAKRLLARLSLFIEEVEEAEPRVCPDPGKVSFFSSPPLDWPLPAEVGAPPAENPENLPPLLETTDSSLSTVLTGSQASCPNEDPAKIHPLDRLSEWKRPCGDSSCSMSQTAARKLQISSTSKFVHRCVLTKKLRARLQSLHVALVKQVPNYNRNCKRNLDLDYINTSVGAKLRTILGTTTRKLTLQKREQSE
jgi:hypothetical protein